MKRVLIIMTLPILVWGCPLMTSAQLKDSVTSSAPEATSGKFTKKRYSIQGGWEIIDQDGKPAIRFREDFRTRSGPDLKVFLSKDTVSDLNGKTAEQNAVKIGVLKSNKGSQTYTIPDTIDLSEYKSVLIHCEAFSVLWGGFDISE